MEASGCRLVFDDLVQAVLRSSQIRDCADAADAATTEGLLDQARLRGDDVGVAHDVDLGRRCGQTHVLVHGVQDGLECGDVRVQVTHPRTRRRERTARNIHASD